MQNNINTGTAVTYYADDIRVYYTGTVTETLCTDDNSYRYGFNGKEKIDEQYGIEGTAYDFGARLYDSRLGRWMAVDPLAGKYPDLSTYSFVMNTPISAMDPDGRDIIPTRKFMRLFKPTLKMLSSTEIGGQFLENFNGANGYILDRPKGQFASSMHIVFDTKEYTDYGVTALEIKTQEGIWVKLDDEVADESGSYKAVECLFGSDFLSSSEIRIRISLNPKDRRKGTAAQTMSHEVAVHALFLLQLMYDLKTGKITEEEFKEEYIQRRWYTGATKSDGTSAQIIGDLHPNFQHLEWIINSSMASDNSTYTLLTHQMKRQLKKKQREDFGSNHYQDIKGYKNRIVGSMGISIPNDSQRKNYEERLMKLKERQQYNKE